MCTTPPQKLTFPDRRRDRRFPVTDASGDTVARIATSWTGTSFSVEGKDGHLLCEASAGLLGLSSTWRAADSEGKPLLSLTRRLFSKAADVHLEGGGVYVLRGSAWKRDFVVTDERAQIVLSAVPRTPALSLRAHDYAVQQTSRVFQLDELIALVQIWRMAQKGDSSTTAANSAAWSAGISS
jgi:uncharacterized protein YxjI